MMRWSLMVLPMLVAGVAPVAVVAAPFEVAGVKLEITAVSENTTFMLGEPVEAVQSRFKSGQPTWRNPTEKNGKLVWYTSAIGSEPHIADVILARVHEARLAGERKKS